MALPRPAVIKDADVYLTKEEDAPFTMGRRQLDHGNCKI